MNILIPNVTGPTNIGDQAILLPAIDLIKANFPKAHLTLHTTTPQLYKKNLADTIDSHLYNWAVFENTTTQERIKRITELGIAYTSLKLGLPLAARGKLKELVKDYLQADVIIFIGGGYLRSKKKFSQSLNLIMVTSSFHFAQLMTAKKIVLPLSFGPFAHPWQEQFSANALRNFDLVSTRESVSFQALQNCKVPNIMLSSDTALLLKVNTKRKIKSGFILGFTIRNWLDKQHQERLEQTFIESISRFAKETHSSVQPIVQVGGDNYGESDEHITNKIARAVNKNHVQVAKTFKMHSLNDSLIYKQIDLLLGMRMHSNILAAVHGTPFVALSYEYKTEGIAKDLHMDGYVIKCDDVTTKNLSALLTKAYKHRVKLNQTIANSLLQVRQKETDKWNKMFHTLLPNYY